jgi:hypothetical protein
MKDLSQLLCLSNVVQISRTSSEFIGRYHTGTIETRTLSGRVLISALPGFNGWSYGW